MTVLQDIFTWSQEQPEWQRDALRRLITTDQLQPADDNQLSTLCKQRHGLAGDTIAAQPLLAEHLRAGESEQTVVLSAVEHIGNVNALPPGAKLVFGDTGLTVVYGDNAAGKSGYARILKRACRARGAGDPVLPNVMSQAPAGTPTAKVNIKADGKSRECVWTDGKVSDPQLAAISVFDSSAASVYVAEKTDVAYRPFGLDLLDKLAKAAERITDILKRERDQLQHQIPRWPDLGLGTSAATFLSRITSLTSEHDIDAASALTPEEEAETQKLRTLLAAMQNNPAARAKELKLKAERMRKLVTGAQALASLVGKETISHLNSIVQDISTAKGVAMAVRDQASEYAVLKGFGEDSWHEMWVAAGKYSTSAAYPGIAYPNTGPEAHCVLCQQTLLDEGRKRIEAFAKCLSDESQRKVDNGRLQIAAATKRFKEALANDNTSPIQQELTVIDQAVGEEASRFLANVRECLKTSCEILTNPNGVLAAFDEPLPAAQLESVSLRLEQEAAEIEHTQDPTEHAKKVARLQELDSRIRLRAIKEEVLGEIQRLRRIQAFETAIKDTQTGGITRKSTELTKKYVSQALADCFTDELRRLNFDNLELELKPVGGERATLYHRISFKLLTRAELHKVVSEGESRCLALAAFLAEVRSSAGKSGIIFDDPVCSLDHIWRERIARRLADESRDRQVIVFTHDLVFVDALRAAAKELGANCKDQHVFRQQQQPGVVSSALPWVGQKTNDRIGVLRADLQKIEKLHRDGQIADYEIYTKNLYRRLRDAWERAAEEILLAGVIERFSKEIQTKRLRDVASNEALDYTELETAMSKCSVQLHDQPAAVNAPMPAPTEIGQDIGRLEEWAKRIRTRRNKK